MTAAFRGARDSRARDARAGVLVSHEHHGRGVLFALLLLLLSGCQTFDVQQTCRFVNDNGEFTEVDYCTSKREYVNEFTVPATGKKLAFSSRLRVKVRLPDDSFRAYQRMNYFRDGSLYESSNGEWLFHANGFTCRVLRRVEDSEEQKGGPFYRQVFAGVLSQPPQAAK